MTATRLFLVAVLIVFPVAAFADTVKGKAQQPTEGMACMAAKTIAQAKADDQHKKVMSEGDCDCKPVNFRGHMIYECKIELEVSDSTDDGPNKQGADRSSNR
jgi:hypothetical protein